MLLYANVIVEDHMGHLIIWEQNHPDFRRFRC